MKRLLSLFHIWYIDAFGVCGDGEEGLDLCNGCGELVPTWDMSPWRGEELCPTCRYKREGLV